MNQTHYSPTNLIFLLGRKAAEQLNDQRSDLSDEEFKSKICKSIQSDYRLKESGSKESSRVTTTAFPIQYQRVRENY